MIVNGSLSAIVPQLYFDTLQIISLKTKTGDMNSLIFVFPAHNKRPFIVLIYFLLFTSNAHETWYKMAYNNHSTINIDKERYLY